MNIAAVQQDVQRFLLSRPDITIAQLCNYTSLSEVTARHFVNGTSGGSSTVAAEFERVLTLARVGEILPPGGSKSAVTISESAPETVRRVPRSREFYLTDTVKKVGQVLDYCVEQSAIGVVTGDYGVGKTEALKAWRRGNGRKVDSIIFEFDEFTAASKLDFINGIAEAFALERSASTQNGGKVFRNICAHLNESPCLLILDQCEAVRDRIFHLIRQIWDRTHDSGVGIVLLSAQVLLRRLQNNRSTDLGALTSRVGIWAPLAGMSRPEMAAILRLEGITDIDEAAFDLWWKATNGSMRRLMRAVDLVKSKHQGKRITEKTVAGVASHLWGMHVKGVEN